RGNREQDGALDSVRATEVPRRNITTAGRRPRCPRANAGRREPGQVGRAGRVQRCRNEMIPGGTHDVLCTKHHGRSPSVPVLLEVTDAKVGVVTLSSPDQLNALTGPEFGELGAVLRSPEARDLRGLVVRGEGRGFSAGADRDYLGELRAMDFDQRV